MLLGRVARIIGLIAISGSAATCDGKHHSQCDYHDSGFSH
jgi:hypothetical protein